MDPNWDPMEAWLSERDAPEGCLIDGIDDVDADTRAIRVLAFIAACFARD